MNPPRTPTVEETATPLLPSAFMMTAAHWPSVIRQVSCCWPGPVAEVVQKVCEVGAVTVAVPGTDSRTAVAVVLLRTAVDADDLVVGDAGEVGVDAVDRGDADEDGLVGGQRPCAEAQVDVESAEHPGGHLGAGLDDDVAGGDGRAVARERREGEGHVALVVTADGIGGSETRSGEEQAEARQDEETPDDEGGEVAPGRVGIRRSASGGCDAGMGHAAATCLGSVSRGCPAPRRRGRLGRRHGLPRSLQPTAG